MRINVFESGKNQKKNTEGVFSYRIPALIYTKKGTLIAGCDRRKHHGNDWGNINSVIRRSFDKGRSWQAIQTIIDLPTNPNSTNLEYDSAFSIDLNFIQDNTTEEIIAIYDVFPEIKGLFGFSDDQQTKNAYIWKENHPYLALYNQQGEQYYISDDGWVYTSHHIKTNYYVKMKSNIPPYHDMGNLYYEGEYVGNIFFNDTQTPLHVVLTNYIWISKSQDDGATWSSPQDITPLIKKEWMSFYGVAPGNAICLMHGEKKGRLVIPMYSTNYLSGLRGSQSTHVIYSDDHGLTWQSSTAVNDGRKVEQEILTAQTMVERHRLFQNTESTIIELNNGDLKLLMRNLTGCLQIATSKDAGETWLSDIETYPEVPEVYCQLSAVHVQYHEQEYIIISHPEGPERTHGALRIAKVRENQSLEWSQPYLFEEGNFAYSALQIVEDKVAVLFEHGEESINPYHISFYSILLDELFHHCKVAID